MSDGPRDTDREFWAAKGSSAPVDRLGGEPTERIGGAEIDAGVIASLVSRWRPPSGFGSVTIELHWRDGRLYRVERLNGRESILIGR